jgi:hypothetical protein
MVSEGQGKFSLVCRGSAQSPRADHCISEVQWARERLPLPRAEFPGLGLPTASHHCERDEIVE